MNAKEWAIEVYRSGLLGIINEGAGVDLYLFGEAAKDLGARKCRLVQLDVAEEFDLNIDQTSDLESRAREAASPLQTRTGI